MSDLELTLDLQMATSAAVCPAESDIRRWAEAALAALRPDEHELCVRLVDEDESATLNERYRGKPGPTNVLSFPFEPPPGMDDCALLGDLVVCVGVFEREAGEQHKSVEAHFAHMIVHGVLHLLGHDHLEEAEATEMEALETHILAGLGFANPYEAV